MEISVEEEDTHDIRNMSLKSKKSMKKEGYAIKKNKKVKKVKKKDGSMIESQLKANQFTELEIYNLI